MACTPISSSSEMLVVVGKQRQLPSGPGFIEQVHDFIVYVYFMVGQPYSKHRVEGPPPARLQRICVCLAWAPVKAYTMPKKQVIFTEFQVFLCLGS